VLGILSDNMMLKHFLVKEVR